MSKGAFLPSPYPGGFQLPPMAYGGRNLFVPPRRMPLPMSLFSPLQTQQPMPMQPPMQSPMAQPGLLQEPTLEKPQTMSISRSTNPPMQDMRMRGLPPINLFR